MSGEQHVNRNENINTVTNTNYGAAANLNANTSWTEIVHLVGGFLNFVGDKVVYQTSFMEGIHESEDDVLKDFVKRQKVLSVSNNNLQYWVMRKNVKEQYSCYLISTFDSCVILINDIDDKRSHPYLADLVKDHKLDQCPKLLKIYELKSKKLVNVEISKVLTAESCKKNLESSLKGLYHQVVKVNDFDELSRLNKLHLPKFFLSLVNQLPFNLLDNGRRSTVLAENYSLFGLEISSYYENLEFHPHLKDIKLLEFLNAHDEFNFRKLVHTKKRKLINTFLMDRFIDYGKLPYCPSTSNNSTPGDRTSNSKSKKYKGRPPITPMSNEKKVSKPFPFETFCWDSTQKTSSKGSASPNDDQASALCEDQQDVDPLLGSHSTSLDSGIKEEKPIIIPPSKEGQGVLKFSENFLEFLHENSFYARNLSDPEKDEYSDFLKLIYTKESCDIIFNWTKSWMKAKKTADIVLKEILPLFDLFIFDWYHFKFEDGRSRIITRKLKVFRQVKRHCFLDLLEDLGVDLHEFLPQLYQNLWENHVNDEISEAQKRFETIVVSGEIYISELLQYFEKSEDFDGLFKCVFETPHGEFISKTIIGKKWTKPQDISSNPSAASTSPTSAQLQSTGSTDPSLPPQITQNVQVTPLHPSSSNSQTNLSILIGSQMIKDEKSYAYLVHENRLIPFDAAAKEIEGPLPWDLDRITVHINDRVDYEEDEDETEFY